MHSLDDPATLAVDTHDLIGATADAVRQFDQAIATADAAEIMFPPDAIDSIVICGMGDAASVGALIAGYFTERLRKPVAVVRDYVLPGWAGERTLVVGMSYSGATEETLTCVADAVDRTCPVIGVSTGGKMTAHYRPEGVPVVEPPISEAPDVGMATTLLVLLVRMGVLDMVEHDVVEARECLQRAVDEYGPQVPAAQNPAKQVARTLAQVYPQIWGAQMTAPVADRWAGQIARRAKLPAVAAHLPEHTHTDLVGMEGLAGLNVRPHVVMVRDPRHHRQIERRLDTCKELVHDQVAAFTTVAAEGHSPLARMFDLMMFGDFMSLYVACARGVDPSSADIVERLNTTLATTGYGRAAAPDPST